MKKSIVCHEAGFEYGQGVLLLGQHGHIGHCQGEVVRDQGVQEETDQC